MKKTTFCESFFGFIEKWLDSSDKWTRSFHKSIGVIEDRNPWRETTWRNGSWDINHWENVRTPSIMSGPVARHTWRLGHPNLECTISVKFGIAPFKEYKGETF